LFNTVTPPKVFESIDTVNPLLNVLEVESAEIIYNHQFGVLFELEGVDDLVDDLLLLYDDCDKQATFREHCLSQGKFLAGINFP